MVIKPGCTTSSILIPAHANEMASLCAPTGQGQHRFVRRYGIAKEFLKSLRNRFSFFGTHKIIVVLLDIGFSRKWQLLQIDQRFNSIRLDLLLVKQPFIIKVNWPSDASAFAFRLAGL